jgi:hypothetical protein
MHSTSVDTYGVENSAQVKSCSLKFVRGGIDKSGTNFIKLFTSTNFLNKLECLFLLA